MCCVVVMSDSKNCSQCDKPIRGPIIKCLQRIYHQSCFKCCKCKAELATKQIYPIQDGFLCDKCYLDSQDKCPVCKQVVVDCKYFTIDRERYHTSCLLCSVCKLQLNEVYYEKSGKFYCYNDFNKIWMPLCSRCGYRIRIDLNTGHYNYLHFDGVVCHLDCFTCDRCREVLPTVSNFLSYYSANGLKLCYDCYEYDRKYGIFPEIKTQELSKLNLSNNIISDEIKNS